MDLVSLTIFIALENKELRNSLSNVNAQIFLYKFFI